MRKTLLLLALTLGGCAVYVPRRPFAIYHHHYYWRR